MAFTSTSISLSKASTSETKTMNKTITDYKTILIRFGFSNQTQATMIIPKDYFIKGYSFQLRDPINNQTLSFTYKTTTTIAFSVTDVRWTVDIYGQN